MTSLYETALNGMGLGTTYHDVDRMVADYRSAGRNAEADLLLEISIHLMELSRAEGQQRAVATALERATKEFGENPTADRAGWLVEYANRAQKATADARAAYAIVGILWRTYANFSK